MITFFLMLVLLRRTSFFDHLLWSIFQSMNDNFAFDYLGRKNNKAVDHFKFLNFYKTEKSLASTLTQEL